jgi:hypothetical protein
MVGIDCGDGKLVLVRGSVLCELRPNFFFKREFALFELAARGFPLKPEEGKSPADQRYSPA